MIIGTAGHIDHGKTSLVRALTGVETDRLREEKARGISIDLGFAYLAAPDGSVLGFVDVPGHERFVHNMLAGATGIDFVLLVVAADDGIKPQTLRTSGDRRSARNRAGDRCPDQNRFGRGIAAGGGHSRYRGVAEADATGGRARFPVSTVTGDGIAELRTHLFDAAHTIRARAASGRFRLAVDRSFTLTGAGTVVTGTVLSGAVSTGDSVMISPKGLTARVRSIHAQNQPSPRGVAGQRCALNLVGESISKDAISRGDVVLDPLLHAPTNRIDVELRLLGSEPKPVTQWMPVRLFHASTDVGARLVLLEDAPLVPGEVGRVQLVLDQPIAAAAGDRFVVRDTTSQRTIGGGTLLDLRAPARKRRTPERLAQLHAHSIGDPEQALAGLLGIAPRFVELSAFARDRALSGERMQEMIERLSIVVSQTADGLFAMSAPVWLELKRTLLAKLQAFHAENPDLPGIGLERLRLQLEPRLPAPALLSVLHGLVRTRDVALDGAWVRLAGHEVRLTGDDERLWARIAPLLSGAERFRPPRVRDIANLLALREGDVRRLLKLVGRMGWVDEVGARPLLSPHHSGRDGRYRR